MLVFIGFSLVDGTEVGPLGADVHLALRAQRSDGFDGGFADDTNPFMPDDPRRIATDTSQKVGIRFGETIKSYIREGRDLGSLVAIPLALAGWLRYLNGTFDDGTPLEVSPDPLKDELMAKVKEGKIREILANPTIFGLDLTTTPLAAIIEGYYARLLEGPGSARRLLQEELPEA